MIQIIPAILATSEEQYKQDLQKLSSCEALSDGWVHIDFADGKFVQNQTIEPYVIGKSSDNFKKEAHLMVIHPKDYLDELVKNNFKRVIIHIESENVAEAIDYALSKGLEVGFAIKDETDIDQLEQNKDKINTVLVMSVVPGFQGQPFLPRALKKVVEIKNKGWQVRVGIDGAVKNDNFKEIIDAGVDFVIVGSYLLKGNVDENMENLWEAVNG